MLTLHCSYSCCRHKRESCLVERSEGLLLSLSRVLELLVVIFTVIVPVSSTEDARIKKPVFIFTVRDTAKLPETIF